MPTYYETLGVSPTAEGVVIDAAYRALMKRYHPDAQGQSAAAEERAKAINDAYRVLKDPSLRSRYDDELLRPSNQTRASRPAGSAEPSAHRPPAQPHAASRRLQLMPVASIGLSLLILVGALGSLANNGAVRAPSGFPVGNEATAGADVAYATANSASLGNAEQAAANAEVLAGPIVEQRPSFNCARAGTEVLRMICNTPELAEADARLAAIYRATLQTSADPRALRDAQRTWLAERDSAVAEVATLRALYTQRLSELAAASNGAGNAAAVQVEHQGVIEPDWVRRPSAEDLERYYPERAQRMNVEGRASISCTVDARGSLQACSVVSEAPADAGFGDAAMRMSKLFKMRPMTKDGAPIDGGKITVPIAFKLPQA